MKASITLILAACLASGAMGQYINTGGQATTCGENTCCSPECYLSGWSDSNGCVNGTSAADGACSNAFQAADDTSDSGVDICDGAGAFFCVNNEGNRVIYVVNEEQQVSAALWPSSYSECTLSGQCGPCENESACDAPVSIGTSDGPHSCEAFAALYDLSGVDLATC